MRLSISAPSSGAGRRRRKGRSFEVELLAWCDRATFSEASRIGAVMTPLWISFAASAAAMPPFLANFRAGVKATLDRSSVTLQVPKTAAYRWNAVPVDDVIIVTAYDPALLHLDVLLQDDDHVEFLVLPTEQWISESIAAAGDLSQNDAIASLFCAYLDRRCRLPLLANSHFHRRLFAAALEDGWLRPATPSFEAPLRMFAELGLHPPLACSINHRDLETFLAHHTAAWQSIGES